MMTFYAAAGSYQIRSEDGKNMPYIMRLGKLQPVSIPEFSLWSMLLWDVLTYEELHKKFYDKMEETEIEPSSFDKSLEMLVKRKLIIKGVGYTGADALYNMLSDTYVIPLRGVQGTRKLMNVAKLLKQKKVQAQKASSLSGRLILPLSYKQRKEPVMKMPPPIATKFTKLVLTILAITILGIILSFVSQDHTLLMLSAGVAVAGGVKIIDYYRTIKGEHYECIEGTLVREQAGYARKRHMIVLALEDGSLEQRILEGRYKLKIGTDYRFYLKREPIAEIQIELPEILQPAIIVLGHEELPFSSGKQI